MEGVTDLWLLLGFSKCGDSEGEKDIVCERDSLGERE